MQPRVKFQTGPQYPVIGISIVGWDRQNGHLGAGWPALALRQPSTAANALNHPVRPRLGKRASRNQGAMPLDADLEARYSAVLASISSDHERLHQDKIWTGIETAKLATHVSLWLQWDELGVAVSQRAVELGLIVSGG